ncbi:MAG: hypothetical protein RL684_798 [Pseudomonadota bacterium]
MAAVVIVIFPLVAGQSRGALWMAMPRWALPAGVAVLAVALAFYLWLGSPQLAARDALVASLPGAAVPSAGASAPQGTAAAPGGQNAGSMESAITGLERRLAQGGGSDADWDLLAKSYEFLNRADDAALARQKKLPPGAGPGADTGATTAAGTPPAMAIVATRPLSGEGAKLKAAADAARLKRDFAAARSDYEKLAARHEMTADNWADYADSVGTLNGGKLLGAPEGMIRQALALDPAHPKALWLQASADEEAGRYAQAVASWQRLAAVVPAGGPDAQAVAAKMAEDQRLAGAAPSAAAPAAAGVAVQGQVVLADALRGKVPAGLTLFIVAKSVRSPGPPVAILRLTTGTWPVTFRLDDSQSMIPGRTLSGAGTVTIEARTSRSGQAMPAAGDFRGVLGPLDPAAAAKAGKPLRLVIDKVVG